VEAKILKGNETIATVPARLVAGQTKTLVDFYGATKQPDGTRVLSTIYFGGKNFNLEIMQRSAVATPAVATATR
jgi:hypothetical protein